MDTFPKAGGQLRELALFAGAGGGILGGRLLGWRTIGAVEINRYAASVLVGRQNDGTLEPFPIWDDIRTFSGENWTGRVDVISGGFPCQDISIAGKGDGLAGERSGLWGEMARVIREVRPKFAFLENSPALLVRGIGDVLSDLASMGYDARWGVLGARCCGGPVERERIWIACADRQHGETRLGDQQYRPGEVLTRSSIKCPDFWLQAPPVDFGVGDGLDSYLDQVTAIGNGQIPIVAAIAWRTLTMGW